MTVGVSSLRCSDVSLGQTRIPLQRSHVSFQRLRTLIGRSGPLGQARMCLLRLRAVPPQGLWRISGLRLARHCAAKRHPDYWLEGLTRRGPILTKPYERKVVLPRIKRLLVARAKQQGSPYDAPTLRHSGAQAAPHLHWPSPRWCLERQHFHRGYRSNSDRVERHPLWGEQNRHRHCEHHHVSAPHDRPGKPRTHRAAVRVARERSVVGAENIRSGARRSAAVKGTLTQSGRVTLAPLYKLDYQFCYELRCRNGAINEAERL
jgi:hypothetical protein